MSVCSERKGDSRDDKAGSADEWKIEWIKESMEGNFLLYSPLLMKKNIRERQDKVIDIFLSTS